MEKELLKLIKYANENLAKLYKLYDFKLSPETEIAVLNNYKDDFKDFLNYAFITTAYYIYSLAKNKENFGISINFYPQSSIIVNSGRVGIMNNNEILYSFIFKNKNSFKIPDNKSELNKSFLELLDPEHIYNKALKVFFDIIKSFQDEHKKDNCKMFSIKDYFEVNPESKCIDFLDSDHQNELAIFDKFEEIYCSNLENYSYEEYYYYLNFTYNKKFEPSFNGRNNQLLSAWESNNKTFINEWKDNGTKYIQYNIPVYDNYDKSAKGNIVIYTDQEISGELITNITLFSDIFISSICEIMYRYTDLIKDKVIELRNLKNAIITILLDSFSHNIASHSLKSLVSIINDRAMVLDTKFKFNSDDQAKKNIWIDVNNNFNKLINNNKHSTYCLSLQDIFDFSTNDMIFGDNLFQNYLDSKILNTEQDSESTERLFPKVKNVLFPLDKYYEKLINFINEKATFWNGIFSDTLSISRIDNLFNIIWGFIDNPLYISNIATDKNVKNIKFYIKTDKDNLQEFVTCSNIPLEKNPSSNQFIILSDNFKSIKEKLQNIDIFLPNGLVGKHSLYTIFENTLRNIKHIKGDVNDLIFNIQIDIIIGKLCKITIWLGHSAEISNDNLGLIKERHNQSIFDKEDNLPVMGGDSQDKICACQLVTNRFIEIQNEKLVKEVDENKIQYPWINIEFEKDDEGGNNYFLKKRFYIWLGEEIKFLEEEKKLIENNGNNSDLVNDNINRYKFIVFKDSIDNTKLKKYSSAGLIRILSTQVTTINEIYKEWLIKWLKCSNFNATIQENADFKISVSIGKNTKELSFKHRTEDTEKFNKRTHGIIDSHYKYNGKFKCDYVKYEFIESFFTNVTIYDTRVFNRIKSKNKNNIINKLNLWVNQEGCILKIKDNDSLKNDMPHILIIHLSAIKLLGYQNEEENLGEFINKNLDVFLSKCNTRLIITTGRSRDNWRKSIENKNYSHKVLFLTIDSILNSINDALNINDDFQIKHNLIKTILGS